MPLSFAVPSSATTRSEYCQGMTGSSAERALFLPGAGGRANFWQPVMDHLALKAEAVTFDYPGFGGNPPDPKLSTLADLTDWIDGYVDRPTDILAQSMGGVIGLQLALRHTDLIRHLVLTGTSGGVPVGKLGAANWQSDYVRENPNNQSWFTDETIDLSARVAHLAVPCLLIFGTRDPVAPLAVGQYLEKLLPNARLVTIDTDSHFFVREKADEVASHIAAFLGE